MVSRHILACSFCVPSSHRPPQPEDYMSAGVLQLWGRGPGNHCHLHLSLPRPGLDGRLGPQPRPPVQCSFHAPRSPPSLRQAHAWQAPEFPSPALIQL